MNPFEQFLRKLFAGGLPPSVIEEDRQAANMGVAADKLPKMAKDIGKSFVDSYKQRALDLQTLADQSIFRQVPLSDYEQIQAPRQAQRDLALDVLSAGLGSGMRVGADILSSAPVVGGSVARNALPKWLQNSSGYTDEKLALREQLLNSFRTTSHPLERSTPTRKIFHSSRGIFEAPTLDPARQGAGIGDFWQGTGAAYVAESPSVRDYYREHLSKNSQELILPSGKRIKDPSAKLDEVITNLNVKLDNARENLYNNYTVENMKAVESLRQQVQSGINRRIAWADPVSLWQPRIKEKSILEEKQDYADLLAALRKSPKSKEIKLLLKESLQRLAQDQKVMSSNIRTKSENPFATSYSGYFYANPDELFNLNIPIAQQPSAERIIAGLNQLPVGSGDLGMVSAGERVGDAIVRQQRNNLIEPNLSSTNSNEMIVSGQRDGGWSDYRPEFTSATPWQTMEALKDKGIVGNQYLDRRSLESIISDQNLANPTYNYVVTDPSRLRFTDLFGAADPFGSLSSTMQAIQNAKQEKKNGKDSKASKK
jgi:hypothetical protein